MGPPLSNVRSHTNTHSAGTSLSQPRSYSVGLVVWCRLHPRGADGESEEACYQSLLIQVSGCYCLLVTTRHKVYFWLTSVTHLTTTIKMFYLILFTCQLTANVYIPMFSAGASTYRFYSRFYRITSSFSRQSYTHNNMFSDRRLLYLAHCPTVVY